MDAVCQREFLEALVGLARKKHRFDALFSCCAKKNDESGKQWAGSAIRHVIQNYEYINDKAIYDVAKKHYAVMGLPMVLPSYL